MAGVTTEYPYSMHVTDFLMGSIPWHWHEELEFGYVVNGQIKIILADRTYTVEKNQERLQNMLTFIHQHFEDKLTLEEIAASASVSTRECIRCFQKTIDRTSIEYLMEYRMDRARKYLEETPMTVTDISLHCGFSSNAYFGKIFREKFGMTPLQYRNRK